MLSAARPSTAGIISTAIVGASTMRGEIGESKQGTVDFYATRGTSPDVVAEAVVTAIQKRRPIQPVPNSHVYPNWIARRISPRLGIVTSRLAYRALRKQTRG